LGEAVQVLDEGKYIVVWKRQQGQWKLFQISRKDVNLFSMV
jgi:hypothetical protein